MNLRNIECYYWLDDYTEDVDGIIRPMCVKCHNEKFPWLGWHYSGPVGPWETICGKCGEVIMENIET